MIVFHVFGRTRQAFIRTFLKFLFHISLYFFDKSFQHFFGFLELTHRFCTKNSVIF